ncbi:unnamed protein product, partial [Protopolystoma xenopodis]
MLQPKYTYVILVPIYFYRFLIQKIKAEAASVLPPGYKLSHCLAEGGIGRVFLVVNPTTKDCLAAKVVYIYGKIGSPLHHNAISSSKATPQGYPCLASRAAQIRADLKQEAEIQRRLKHHNIAAAYGIRNTPSFSIMFMELITCGELFDRIPVGIGLHIQQMFMYYVQ